MNENFRFFFIKIEKEACAYSINHKTYMCDKKYTLVQKQLLKSRHK